MNPSISVSAIKLVYPNHGVGLLNRSAAARSVPVERFYLLRIRSSSLKVMVPFHNADASACAGWSRTAKSRRSSNILTDGKCESTATGSTASRKIPTRCAPAPCGSGHRAEGLLSLAAEAAQLPRKEDAGTRPLPADQRDGHGPRTGKRNEVEENSAGCSPNQSCAFPRLHSPKPEPLFTASYPLSQTYLQPIESNCIMSGTLHIFRRRIANGGEIYQLNYTTTGSTFAKVFDRTTNSAISCLSWD